MPQQVSAQELTDCFCGLTRVVNSSSSLTPAKGPSRWCCAPVSPPVEFARGPCPGVNPTECNAVKISPVDRSAPEEEMARRGCWRPAGNG